MVVLKGNSGWQSTAFPFGRTGPSQFRELVVAAHDIVRICEKRLTHFRRKAIGMVFQSFNLLPTLTVFENPVSGAAGRTVPSGDHTQSRRAAGLAAPRSPVTHLPASSPVARCSEPPRPGLINDPAIILADEPTGNLDSRNGEVVMALLSESNRAGHRTVVVATHSSLADPHATRQMNLKVGRIADQT